MGAIARRRFLTGIGAALALSATAGAQQRTRLPVLGVLSPKPPPSPEAIAKSPLTRRLRELGWLENDTLQIERLSAENDIARLPSLAATLAEKNVDVILALGQASAVAAARATKTIPIVFWWTGIPVELGLVDSYARPGRNVTGTAWSASGLVETYLKQAELLREIAPAAKRLARLRSVDWLRTLAGDLWDGTEWHASIDAGMRAVGFDVRRFEVRQAADFDATFLAIEKWRPDALFVQGGDLMLGAGKRIVELARRNRLPDVYAFHYQVEQGGLISYSFNPVPSLVRSAEYVDRILRGAHPADLPVELPQHYQIVVNLKTAKALGLTVPQSILLRADRVLD